MKRILFFLGLSALVSINALAQIQRKPAPKPATDTTAPAGNPVMESGQEKNRKQLLRELKLSKAQKEKMKTMRAASQNEKAKIEQSDSLNAAEKKARLRELKQQQAEKVKTMLTDEQKAKVAAWRQQERKKKKASGNE